MSNTLTAIVDVTSANVGGALLSRPKRKKARAGEAGVCANLVASTRQPLNLEGELNLERFLNQVEKALEGVLRELLNAKLGTPERVWCFFSAPFYVAQSRLIEVKFASPKSITPKLLAQAVAAELTQFKNQHPKLFAAQEGREPHQVVENEILEIKLNGYQPKNPYEHSAKEVAVVNYFSFVDQKLLNRFNQLTTKTLPRAELEFRSFLFAFYQVWRSLAGPEGSYLVLHVGGELSELALVWRGVLWQVVSYPLGANTLLQKLSHKLATSSAEADSALKMYLAGHQQEQVARSLEQALAEVKSEWLNLLREALTNVTEGALLVEEFFIVGESEWLGLLKSWVGAENFAQGSLGPKKLKPVVVSRELLARFCLTAPGANPDLPLLIEAIFCDKILDVK